MSLEKASLLQITSDVPASASVAQGESGLSQAHNPLLSHDCVTAAPFAGAGAGPRPLRRSLRQAGAAKAVKWAFGGAYSNRDILEFLNHPSHTDLGLGHVQCLQRP